MSYRGSGVGGGLNLMRADFRLGKQNKTGAHTRYSVYFIENESGRKHRVYAPTGIQCFGAFKKRMAKVRLEGGLLYGRTYGGIEVVGRMYVEGTQLNHDGVAEHIRAYLRRVEENKEKSRETVRRLDDELRRMR